MARSHPARRAGRVATALAAAAILVGSPAATAEAPEPPPATPTPSPQDGQLRSELLFDLVFERGQATSVGSPGGNRVVVPVSTGTFEGPKLKGTVIAPSGDAITIRQDGSSVLDLRLLLQTDDGQKILMTCRGLAYPNPDGTLFARLQPLFETGAEKYAWLNKVVAIGVFRQLPGKVSYRVYRIL
jgi:hypothetical protein